MYYVIKQHRRVRKLIRVLTAPNGASLLGANFPFGDEYITHGCTGNNVNKTLGGSDSVA